MRNVLQLCGGLLAIAALACGGSDDNGGRAGSGGGGAGSGGGGNAEFDAGSDPNRNQVMPGTVCARLATINCAGEQYCCDDPGRTFDACRNATQSACEGTFALDTIAAAPEVAFDAAAASAAFATLEQRASMCDPTVAAWAVSQEGFASTVAGTLGNGEDCEPEGGLDASIPALLTALASCRIGMDLACLPGDSGWTCAPRGAAGSRCYTDLNCADGLYCDNEEGDFNGVCAERKAAGASCGAGNQCRSFVCRAGSCTAEDDVQGAYCQD